jgi:hypothetical protein
MARALATLAGPLLACVLALQGGPAAAAASTPEPAILKPAEVGAVVGVEDLSSQGNRVSGAIVNRSPHPIRDVRLVIGEVYSWPNEYRPGQESPNRAETLVVGEEIPPGGRVPFSTTLNRPTPPKTGGSFATKAYVVGFSEVLPPVSPSAGEKR